MFVVTCFPPAVWIWQCCHSLKWPWRVIDCNVCLPSAYSIMMYWSYLSMLSPPDTPLQRVSLTLRYDCLSILLFPSVCSASQDVSPTLQFFFLERFLSFSSQQRNQNPVWGRVWSAPESVGSVCLCDFIVSSEAVSGSHCVTFFLFLCCFFLALKQNLLWRFIMTNKWLLNIGLLYFSYWDDRGFFFPFCRTKALVWTRFDSGEFHLSPINVSVKHACQQARGADWRPFIRWW